MRLGGGAEAWQGHYTWADGVEVGQYKKGKDSGEGALEQRPSTARLKDGNKGIEISSRPRRSRAPGAAGAVLARDAPHFAPEAWA